MFQYSPIFRLLALPFCRKEKEREVNGDERKEEKQKGSREDRGRAERRGCKKMRNKRVCKKERGFAENHNEKEQTRAVNCFQGVRNPAHL